MSQPLRAGLQLGGHRLERRLGVGATGEVWLAQREGAEPRAIKVCPLRNGVDDARAFRREFEQLRPLRLPHVVRVYELGSTDQHAFFTMDVAPGEQLHTWVQQATSLASRVRRLCEAGRQIARGLAAIHRVGLAHRDLKPANIHVDNSGRVTILDFGTARFGAARESSSAMMGTIPYMAPEQRVGLPHDRRVDAYALGATLHEALSGTPAGRWRPGRPRPPLIRLGPEVPRTLSWLVDGLLSLDPSSRPTADEVARMLDAIMAGHPLPAAPWPSPPDHFGHAERLTQRGPWAVVGPIGSGRGRMLQEARWQWYRKGYRSIAARGRRDRPFGVLRDLLAELFRPTVGRRPPELDGRDMVVLQSVWPELPVATGTPPAMLPAPATTAAAIARVLKGEAPLGIALIDIDEADAGSAAVLPHLVRQLPEGIRVWASSRRPVQGMRQIRPPPWTPAAERDVLPGLLPDGHWPDGSPGRTPLESCARAWRHLARWRGEPGPTGLAAGGPHTPDLQALAVLPEPFPSTLARRLTRNLRSLVAGGHLVPGPPPGDRPAPRAAPNFTDEGTESTDILNIGLLATEDTVDPDSLEASPWLRFTDPGTRMLARATGSSVADRNADAARTWADISIDRHPELAHDRARGIASHSARARNTDPVVFVAAAASALGRDAPAEVDRWLQLHTLHGGTDHSWTLRLARAATDLRLAPRRVSRSALEQLAQEAPTVHTRVRAWALLLDHTVWHGDPEAAVSMGLRFAGDLAAHPDLMPGLAARIAHAALASGDPVSALDHLRRHPIPDRSPTPARVDATNTAAQAHLDLGEPRVAASLAAPIRDASLAAGRAGGTVRLSIRLAQAALDSGRRTDATDALSLARSTLDRHPDPIASAEVTLLDARMAIEAGDPTAAAALLDELRAPAERLQLGRVRRDMAALMLELAVHTADPKRARDARILRAASSCQALADPWPAALARWRWLTGDLSGALAATTSTHPGHAECAARAERARLLLVGARYPDARQVARRAADQARSTGMLELARFCDLVAGAAAAWPDRRFAPLLAATRRDSHVHLYLGALHLDAIRRQLRGGDARHVLSELRTLSHDRGHQLYSALARVDGW